MVNRILQAGLKAPTNNHLREWEFVVLRSRQSIEAALGQVREKAQQQMQALASRRLDDCQRSMYLDAVPKQYHMLSQSGCLILPFYKQNGDLLRPSALQSLNGFAAVWCCIENILLAAAAEGLGCAIRIPTGEEWKFAASQIGAPEGYIMPCYLALGYPADDAALPKQEPIDPLKKSTWRNGKQGIPLSKILLAAFLFGSFFLKKFDPAHRFSVTFEAVRRFFL